jgi:hypothetical protein
VVVAGTVLVGGGVSFLPEAVSGVTSVGWDGLSGLLLWIGIAGMISMILRMNDPSFRGQESGNL